MVVFPNAKINIGLFITNKRDDGFHDLETVFYPIPFCDALEVMPNKKNEFNFTCSGLPVENTSENLCIKAYKLIRNDYPFIPELQMWLHKAIPTGAGLGGGSADASFTLKLLNEEFQLNISEEKLLQYALSLGSDCPFFIQNKACIAKGRGEIMEPVNVDLRNYYIIVVHPGIHINTGWAFKQLQPKPVGFSLKKIAEEKIETWRDFVRNDFEKPVFELYPEIKKIKEELYKKGALFASMTGSGSSVYGLFSEDPANIEFEFKAKYLRFISVL
ncbi:MAG: 4-(cytidine 5'-diphospho)-2-C-methyl-D-erythritol kinase [Arachidicoccus sp.]|nr:4-(cytidine 5'-diphospho)-2-C-methyl-D-erythritol kinase [Arachidicoccus sp.]